MKEKKKMSEQSFALCGEIQMEHWLLDRKHFYTLTRYSNKTKTWGIFKATGWSERAATTTLQQWKEKLRHVMQLLLVSAISDRPIIKQAVIAVETSYDISVANSELLRQTCSALTCENILYVHRKY